jgi:hypothetical protein
MNGAVESERCARPWGAECEGDVDVGKPMLTLEKPRSIEAKRRVEVKVRRQGPLLEIRDLASEREVDEVRACELALRSHH